MKYEIEIDAELIPEGMRPVAFRKNVDVGEHFFAALGDQPYLILEPIELWPKELIGRWAAWDEDGLFFYPRRPEFGDYAFLGACPLSLASAKQWLGFEADPPALTVPWDQSLTYIASTTTPIGDTSHAPK